jgi:3-carboxy-cis,cis-muconate cycloisomerase
MPFLPTESQVFGLLFADAELAQVFSDQHYLGLLLRVEGALAKVQGRLGVIPKGPAKAIAQAIPYVQIDVGELAQETQRDGFPIIGLLQQAREQLPAEAAPYLHWGATTQDIMDTALMLQLREGLGVLEPKLQQVIRGLARLAKKHRSTLMAGRTHSQQALPITFGLKAANWLAPLLRHRQRLAELKPRLLVVQFGGAAGTLASLGTAGLKVGDGLAAELKLGSPLSPWHSGRDTLAELAGWLSLVSGSLAKIAQDIILLAQSEVAEVRESDDPSRGGSSTMPQKSNPIVSELVVTSARANASLLASMHQALIAEHERATHGWQLEWLTLPQMLAHTATALNKSLYLAEHLVVDKTRMETNIQASQGLMMAEALSFALSQHLGRAEAKTVVKAAVAEALASGKNLLDIARARTDTPIDWESLRESSYLGATQEFIDRVLKAAQGRKELP